ncbi:MAG: LysE family translocator [Proteobacteria bacterium]|nr:LysE family translocator [Pseudomonadota bacterium]
MFEIQHYSSFILAILIFQMAPGPGTFVILGAAARGGLRSGMSAVCGTLAGDLVYMLAAALGLAALLAAAPVLFVALQWLGIAYLGWIGLALLRESAATQAAAADGERSSWQYFRRGFGVALTNPKVVLFFMAFFPLFMRADARPATLVSMMLHVTLLSLLYQLGLVLIGNLLARRLAKVAAARRIANRLAGMALIGCGIKLAFDQQ